MLNKIAWLVDPFTDKEDMLSNQLKFLAAISNQNNTKVYPYFIFSAAHFGFNSSFFEQVKEELKKKSFTLLREILENLNTKNIGDPVIIESDTGSVRKSARHLLEKIESDKMDAVVVNSSKRSTISKVVLGSFSRALIHKSQLPTLILNPKSQIKTPLRNILFLTDLGQSQDKTLIALGDFCRNSNTKLHIYNKVEFMLPVTEDLFLSGSHYLAELNKTVDDRQNQMEKIVRSPHLKNIQIQSHVETEASLFEDAMIEYIKENNIDLVVTIARSSASKSFLLGSTSKSILEYSPVPVWFFH